MMKIFFSSDIFLLQRYGGISRYFTQLASNLAKKKECDLSIGGSLFLNEHLNQAPSSIKRGKMIYLNTRIGYIINYISKIFQNIHNKIYKPDIIHCTYYSRNIKKIKGTKLVVTVFDMIHELFADQYSKFDCTSANKRRSVKVADHIICISEQTKKDLIRLFGVDEKKISVTMLGFSLPKTHTVNLIFDKAFILFVGSRKSYKNFKSLFIAYASNAELFSNYNLIAFGGEPFSKDELSMLADFKLSGNVIHISGDDSKLAFYYMNASIFVYPSMYEGFGIPPLEAMSFGCPVACSNVSSIPEVVGDAAAKFDPESVKSIESALLKVLKDPNYKSDLIRRGRERVKLFSWESCADQTFEIYRKILN